MVASLLFIFIVSARYANMKVCVMGIFVLISNKLTVDKWCSYLIILFSGVNLVTAFVLDTLSQLPELPEGCILHSNQSSVYTSYDYQKAVKKKGIIMSMSRKGAPADNSTIETFHSSLKSETFYLDDIYYTTDSCVMNIVEGLFSNYVVTVTVFLFVPMNMKVNCQICFQKAVVFLRK